MHCKQYCLLTFLFIILNLAAIESSSLNEEAKWNSFNTASGVETRFSFQNDSHYIYLKIICEEPEIEKLKKEGKIHDVDVWKEDNVEIFINPCFEGENFAQFAVGVSGTMYDAKIIDMLREPQWNPRGIQAVILLTDTNWQVEIKLPVALFVSLSSNMEWKKSINQDSWSFNIVRNRKSASKKEVASFSKCDNWLDRKRYSRLTGLNAVYNEMLWNISAIEAKNIKPEKNNIYAAEATYTVDNLNTKLKTVKIQSFLTTLKKGNSVAISERKILLDQDQFFKASEKIQLTELGQYVLPESVK